MSKKSKHRTFAWEYFDRRISKFSKELLMKQNSKQCCCHKEHRMFDKWLAMAPKMQTCHRQNKVRRNQMSLVIHNLHFLQSVSRVLILLHSLINIKFRGEIVAKLVAVGGFPPSAVSKSEFICQSFID